MSKLTVFFDMDGVLADFVKGFTTLARSLFPEVPVTTTLQKDSWEGFPGMTGEQIGATWKEVSHSVSFWSTLPSLVTRADLWTIQRLHEHETVYFTTNRHGWQPIGQTRNWLINHGIVEPNVILADRKGELARALHADYMIDDKAGNAVYADYHARPRIHSFILDRKYNRFDPEVLGSKVQRVHTVKEYLDAIWKA